MLNALVVEDNQDFRDLLMDVLRAELPTIQVSGVASAEQALKTVEDKPPHLVVMDVRLPGMNGLELAKRLRRRFPAIAIVVLTSYDTHEYREAAAKYEVDRFLVKGSSTMSEIVDILRSILADRPAP